MTMDHVAIMKKSWGLLPKILSGEKRIESRWYRTKHTPWGKIRAGDVIYFKNSGEPVAVKAKVEKVLSYSDLIPEKVHEILVKYGRDASIKPGEIDRYFRLFKDKKYCMLIFLDNPENFTPFNIDKTGFGAMTGWITVEHIGNIKV